MRIGTLPVVHSFHRANSRHDGNLNSNSVFSHDGEWRDSSQSEDTVKPFVESRIRDMTNSMRVVVVDLSILSRLISNLQDGVEQVVARGSECKAVLWY